MTKEQRRRNIAARASFLEDAWKPLLNREYFGKPNLAPKKWKRQWRRDWGALKRFRLADRRYRRFLDKAKKLVMTRQEWQQKFAKHLIDTTDCGEHFAMKCAADFARELEEEALTVLLAGFSNEVKWESPVWYANHEIASWSDDL